MKHFLMVVAVLPFFLIEGSVATLAGEDGNVPEKLAAFYHRLATSSVEVDYTYSLKTDRTVVMGNGRACVQGNMYRMTMNGMELYYDGSTLWGVDREGQEVVIESVGLSGMLLDNPVLFVSGIERLFDIRKTASGYYDRVEYMRKKVNRVALLPKEDSEVLSVDVYYNDDFSVMLGASIHLKNGTVTEVTVPSMEFQPLKDSSYFVFDTSSVEDIYVITDMR